MTITRGNSKLGKVLNLSLPPGVTCRKNAPCLKNCYANNHAYRLYGGTRRAWDTNLLLYRTDPGKFWTQLHSRILRARNCRLFRWHVGGDIPDMDYLTGMRMLAVTFPRVQFLCFTKRYELVESWLDLWKPVKLPANLHLVMSAWPGLEIPRSLTRKFPVAWMRDPCKQDIPIPESAQECPGGCDRCMKCFDLKAGQSVVFDKH